MSKAAILPEEILSKIFIISNSAAELGEFRTVCKSWNDPAAHLFKDSSKISLIRHMDFNIETEDLPLVYGELLRMVHSPKIERLTGTVKANGFLETLWDIEESMGFVSEQLRELPTYTGGDNLLIRKRLLLLRNHYTALILNATRQRTNDSWFLLDRLDRFQNLTSLRLRGSTNGLSDLEDILKKCKHLWNLQLENFELASSTLGKLSKADVSAWTAANSKANNKVTTIIIDSTFQPELLEYLVYRYPNIQKVEIKGYVGVPSQQQSQNDALNNGDLSRVLDVISNINEKDISIFLPMSTAMVDCVRFSKAREEGIEYDIQEADGKEQLVLKIY
ncbi:hypothetical protein MBANPS3_010576 [Mucor bainieri]